MRKFLSIIMLLCLIVLPCESLNSASFMEHSTGTNDSTNSGTSVSFNGSRVRNSEDVSINTSTSTPLTFDTEDADTTAYHDVSTSTSRFSITDTAYYNINCSVRWATDTTGLRQMWIAVDGANSYGEDVDDAPSAELSESVTVLGLPLNAGQYVECYVWHDKGSALNVAYVANTSPRFEIQKAGD